MKIALILLICLVSVSYQQQMQRRSWMSSLPDRYSYYISPRLLLDYIYANQYAEEDQYESMNYAEDDSDLVQGRVPSNSLNKQSKFLFGPLGLNAILNSGLVATTTKTVLATTTLTTTVASVQSCIAAAQFVAASTLQCSRRRRRWALADEPEFKLQEESVQPSQVQLVDTTMAPSDVIESRALPEIESSQDASNNNEVVERRNARYQRALWSIVSTTTSTITSYSFVPTIIKKNFVLVAGASLSCLPVGYTIC